MNCFIQTKSKKNGKDKQHEEQKEPTVDSDNKNKLLQLLFFDYLLKYWFMKLPWIKVLKKTS